MTDDQAIILCDLINHKKLNRRKIKPIDLVILTQVGAIKVVDGQMECTKAGKLRFLKFAKSEGYV
jgi:hypothetical protein